MAFSPIYLPGIKAAWEGGMSLSKRGQILFAKILDMFLYIILQRLIDRRWLKVETCLAFGSKHNECFIDSFRNDY